MAAGNIWVVLGPPGSGKGTYSQILAERFGMQHLSTGDLARDAARDPKHADLKKLIDAGQLLPDEAIIELLSERLQPSAPEGKTPAAILDGFPRSVAQAKLLGKVSLALVFELGDKHILAKIGGRCVCSACKKTYNVCDIADDEDGVYLPPILPRNADAAAAMGASAEQLACDNCGNRLSRRSDDAVEVAAERLRLHHAREGEIVDFYRRSDVLLEHKVRHGVADMPALEARIRAFLQSAAHNAGSTQPSKL